MLLERSREPFQGDVSAAHFDDMLFADLNCRPAGRPSTSTNACPVTNPDTCRWKENDGEPCKREPQTQIGDGATEVALGEVRNGATVVGVRVVRIERDRRTTVGDGAIEVTFRPVDQ